MTSMESKDQWHGSNQVGIEQEGGCELSDLSLDDLPLSSESQIIPPLTHSTCGGTVWRKLRAQPRLVIISGPNRGIIVWLDKDEIVIGRDTLSGLCLNDDAVSRKQCAVRADGGSYLIIDFNSRNGSFVNGVPIREKVLQHGDKIRIGCTELVFLADGERPALPVHLEEEDQALQLTNRILYSSERGLVLDADVPDKIAPRPSLKPIPVPVAPPLTDMSPLDGRASLDQFTKVISRQRPKLLAFVGFAMLAAVLIQLLAPKLYEGAALVKVERHSAGGVVGQEASQVSSVDDMDQIITTQIEMAQSDPVLRPVVERYNLLPDKKQVHGATSEQMQQNPPAPIELKGLKVTRPPNSYLVRIAYRDHDPQRAADVANAVAQSLTEHANDTGKSSFEKITALVAQDMSELRAKMEASERQLAEYEKELNMVDPEQRVSILTSRLAQINTEFTTAQAERIRREAIQAQVNDSKTLASAQAAGAAAQDTLLSEAVQRLNIARQQFTSVRSFYAEGHPEYVKAQKQVQEVQAQVDELQARAKERATAEYRQALGRENRLLSILQQTKQEADSLKARAHQYEQLKSEADNDKKIYQDLATRTRLEGINQQFQNASVQIAARALVPEKSIFPKLWINLPLALALSGILGILVAVLADALDTTLSDPEEVASHLHIDVLASIPASKSLPSLSPENGAAARAVSSKRSLELTACYGEAIRALRTALSLSMSDRPMRNLLVTSAVPGEGKSTIAAHLAVACAQMGRKVLLVDANLRRPTLDKTFKVAGPIGLSDVLMGKRPYTDAVIKLEQPGLFLMPAGPVSRTAADLIGTRSSTVLSKIQRDFDLVIVDAPSILAAPETQELAGAVDGVLLLTKAGGTGAKLVSEALSRLLRARANVVGLVLNQVKAFAAGYSGSYHLEASDANAMPRLRA
jgi:polysaccharide biosynthesis transport protein